MDNLAKSVLLKQRQFREPHIYCVSATAINKTFTVEESGTLCVTYFWNSSGSTSLKINGTTKSVKSSSSYLDRYARNYIYSVKRGDTVTLGYSGTIASYRCLAFVVPNLVEEDKWSFSGWNDSSGSKSFTKNVTDTYIIGCSFLSAYNGSSNVTGTNVKSSKVLLSTTYGNEIVLFDCSNTTGTIKGSMSTTKGIFGLTVTYMLYKE